MFDDPIVEEVRKIRRQIEEECNNDFKAYYEHLLALQEKYRKRLVKRSPRIFQILEKATEEAI